MAEEQNTGGIIERLRNSPRTVSTIIVILIIAGAIFAFSDRGSAPSSPQAEVVEEAGEQPADTTQEDVGAVPGGEGAEDSTEVETPAPTPLPEPTETADAYSEVAGSGEGVTHLARKAAVRYLETNPPDFEITSEHRVFIEDYLKDQTGRTPLGLGETVTFSKDLVREAVEASKGLSDAQLKNLQKYSRVVQWS